VQKPISCSAKNLADFTALERAALRSIFMETPLFADGLEAQYTGASVVKRENSGGGFFTTISVGAGISRVSSPRILGQKTSADIEGLQYGMGFVLFMKDGYLNLLEGYAIAGNTTALDLTSVKFTLIHSADG